MGEFFFVKDFNEKKKFKKISISISIFYSKTDFPFPHDVSILERFKRYQGIIKKNDSRIFEANIRCWRHYLNYWDEFCEENVTNFEDDPAFDSDDESCRGPARAAQGQSGVQSGPSNLNEMKRQIISKGYTEALKLATKILLSLDDYVWTKYIYTKIKKLKAKNNEISKIELDKLIKISEGFFKEQLNYLQITKDILTKSPVTENIYHLHLAGKFLKLECKSVLHLGDLSRYDGDNNIEALLNANFYYMEVLEKSNFNSGFALNQVASVETALFEKHGTQNSSQYALAMYCLGIFAFEGFKGSEANMIRLEEIVGEKNLTTKAVDIKEEHLGNLLDGLYLGFKFPGKVLMLATEIIQEGYERFVKTNANAKEKEKATELTITEDPPNNTIKSGFKVAKGSLALGFAQNKKVQAASNSPKIGLEKTKSSESYSSTDIPSDSARKEELTSKNSQQQQQDSTEFNNRLINSIILIIALQKSVLIKIATNHKSFTDENGLQKTCYDNFLKILNFLKPEAVDKDPATPMSQIIRGGGSPIDEVQEKSKFLEKILGILESKLHHETNPKTSWFYQIYYKVLCDRSPTPDPDILACLDIKNFNLSTIYQAIQAGLNVTKSSNSAPSNGGRLNGNSITNTKMHQGQVLKINPSERSEPVRNGNGKLTEPPISIKNPAAVAAPKMTHNPSKMALPKNFTAGESVIRSTQQSNEQQKNTPKMIPKEIIDKNDEKKNRSDRGQSSDKNDKSQKSNFKPLPRVIMLDTSILLNNLNFIKDILTKSEHLNGPLVVPSLTVDGLDVIKNNDHNSRAATNWLISVKDKSFLDLVSNQGEYLKYSARSKEQDQNFRDRTRIKQLCKFLVKSYNKLKSGDGEDFGANFILGDLVVVKFWSRKNGDHFFGQNTHFYHTPSHSQSQSTNQYSPK